MRKFLSILLVLCSSYSIGQIDFIPNKGQLYDFDGNTHPEILYKIESPGCFVYFKKDGIFYQFFKDEEKSYAELTEKEREAFDRGDFAEVGTKRFYYQLNMDFVSSNADVQLSSGTETDMTRNYYLAHCPDGILNVKAVDEITYKNLYDNIDLRFYAFEGQLKYDIILHPGANPEKIQFKYDGYEGISLSEGELLVKTPLNDLSDSKPVAAYANGEKSEVAFSLDSEKGIVSFDVEDFDANRKLIIDPTIEWGTYFGGASSASWTRAVFDSNDNLYNAGYTSDASFPVLNAGAGQYFDGTKDGSNDLVIVRFNADHSQQWATYYGGDASDYVAGYTDYGKAIAINSSNEIYVAGLCQGSTTTFPTQDMGGGSWFQDDSYIYGESSFLLKFDANGVRQWATIFQHNGTPGQSEAIRFNGIACDGTRLYFTGQLYNWNGNGAPITALPGAYNNSTFVGSQDIFLGRFGGTGSLEWCTYVNGGGTNEAWQQGVDMHIDGNGNLLFVGRETNVDPGSYPLINPGGGAYYQSVHAGNQDLVITKFNSSMSMVWSTYYGGDSQDIPSMITADGNNNILIVCRSVQSTNWPTTNPGGGAYYSNSLSAPGNTDGGILKFNTSGVAQWCTYIAGTGTTNYMTGIGTDNSNNIYVMGYTNSSDFPVMNEVGSYYDGTLSGSFDCVFTKFTSGGVQQWGTYYGGTANETLYNGKGTVKGTACGTDIVSFGLSQSSDINFVDPGGGAYFQNTGASSNSFIFYFSEAGGSPSTAPTSISGTTTVCAGNSTTLTQVGGSLGTGANYQWYSGSCGGTPVGSGSSVNVSPATTTDYFVRVEGACGTTTCATVTVTVETNSTAATSISSTANPICPGDNITLSVNGGSLGTGANWEWYTGSCGGTPVGTGTSINVSPSAATTYYVRAEGNCNTTTCQSITINMNTLSTAATSANASPTTICDGDATTLTITGGSLGTGAGWEWYTGSCGGTSVGSGTSINPSPSTTTTYFVRAEGTCNTTACQSVTVTVNPVPSPSITSGTSICEGSTMTLTGTPAGGTWSVLSGPGTLSTDQLTATGSGTINVEYTVTQSGCTGTITQNITADPLADPSWTSPGTVCESGGTIDLDALVTGDAGGTWSGTGVTGSTFDPTGQSGNTITVTYNVGGTCPNSEQHDIIVEATVTATWTQPSALCQSDAPINLDTLVTGSTGGSWTGSGVTGTLFDPTGLSGMISITYTVGSGSCTDMLTQDIEVLTSPATPTFTANDSTICAGETVTLSGTGSGSVDYNIYDAPGGNLLGTAPLDVTPNTTTTYYLEAFETNGCGNIGGAQPLTINVNPAPSLTLSNDQNICLGETVTLTATGTGTLVWSTSETTNSIDVSPTTTTDYTATLTDGNGCTATASVTVNVQSTSTVTAVDDAATTGSGQLVNVDVGANDTGDPTTISIITGATNGVATVQNDNTIDYLPLTGFLGEDSIIYTICDVFCASICDTATLNITVQDATDLEIPGGFSPNGDGINEVFIIEGLDAYPNNTLTIFNRWGDIVFTATPYNNDWSGQAEGKRTITGDEVVTGTYFYVLTLDSNTDPINGSIEIKK